MLQGGRGAERGTEGGREADDDDGAKPMVALLRVASSAVHSLRLRSARPPAQKSSAFSVAVVDVVVVIDGSGGRGRGRRCGVVGRSVAPSVVVGRPMTALPLGEFVRR